MITIGGRRSNPPYKKQTKPHSLRSSGAKSCGLWFLASKKQALVSQFLGKTNKSLSYYPFIGANTIYRLKKFITAYRCLSAEEVISKFDVAYASRWQSEERYAVSYVDHSFEAKRKYTRNLKSRIWA